MYDAVKLGQNFLVNIGILEKIIECSELTKDDCVIEVGTGLGSLTERLAQISGEVLTYEIDPILYQRTSKKLSYYSNIKFFNQDFLEVDLLQTLTPFSKYSFKIVANIPYNVSTAILYKIVQTPIPWKMLVLMVQKEFGQKIIASPGEKKRVPLSVIFQMRFQVQQRFEVSRGSFRPMPRVESMVLQCLPRPGSLNIESINRIADLAQYLFKQKRKKISNILKPIIDPAILNATGFPIIKRPEDLTHLEWLKLMEILSKTKE